MATVITDNFQDIPRIDGAGKRLNDNRVCLNTQPKFYFQDTRLSLPYLF
jgi:hypothetical protein